MPPPSLASFNPRRVGACPKLALHGKRYRQCEEGVWKDIRGAFDLRNVFVNVSYDDRHQARLHYIIATLEVIGLNPILASNKVNEAPMRTCKLCELFQYGVFAIHDLTERHQHNMPFELGFSLPLGKRPIVLFGHKEDHGYVGGKERLGSIVDVRLSDIRDLTDSIVYFDAKQPATVAEALITRWRDSKELLSIVKKNSRSLITNRKSQALESIHATKAVIDRLYKREKNYEAILKNIRSGVLALIRTSAL